MREVAFAALGSWLYIAVVVILAPLIGSVGAIFLVGYFAVATVDLWRCWASVKGQKATPLELAVAVLALFPIGSLLWLPWDVASLITDRRPDGWA